jgi:regulator of protease activity HflC (stomatin/prohibitin superfamily)
MTSGIKHSRVIQLGVRDLRDDLLSIFSKRNADNKICIVVCPKPRGMFKLGLLAPHGTWCLKTRWGKYDGVAKVGINMFPPWVQVSHCVTKQSVVYDAPVERAVTKDNVRVGIDTFVVFRVVDPYPFVYNLGAGNFDGLLAGTMQESVRLLLRNTLVADVLNLRGDGAGVLLKNLNVKFEEHGVLFTECRITDIRLVDEMVQNLSTIAIAEVEMANRQREHEFLCKEIQIKTQFAVEEERRSAETTFVVESGKKERQMVHYNWWTNTQADQMRMFRVNQIPVEATCRVNEISAKAEKARKEAELEALRIREVSKEEAVLAEVKVTAEIYKEAEVVVAEADAQLYKATAECLTLEAAAENPRALAPKRAYQIALTEAEKSREIAKNEPLLFVGNAGDKLINAIITGSLTDTAGDEGIAAHRLLADGGGQPALTGASDLRARIDAAAAEIH